MESQDAVSAEGGAIIRVLAAVLERLIHTNAHLTQTQVTKFHALKPPQITILAYLERIFKYASCSSECFILALIYIDRLISKNNFVLTELNVHRVLITAVMLAAKFFDDAYYNNAYYAKVGGIVVTELNLLEVEFLFRIQFELHCPSELYSQYHTELIHHALGVAVPNTTAGNNIYVTMPNPTVVPRVTPVLPVDTGLPITPVNGHNVTLSHPLAVAMNNGGTSYSHHDEENNNVYVYGRSQA
mmetsp:Transcript_25820/g.40037  ORF Transcript_25820/g.40037 Transcript_25820/m.40037 type:complete len:243 (-) Transcript_25820:115-843(-)|eukprot:CAMPEP_0196812288 /NCGR_PEP_ID=MMETSP1362-20130617/24149_1 /TAXON_ID=163516 /ORGANISM="Leptocylindrus danicus, Strain CCMP1856" /LENGTH=242 /DNA_ID=CAMNT_0042187851 /DNA_START=389 /DNA_END=1117 /DNA_ORIENTATION=+